MISQGRNPVHVSRLSSTANILVIIQHKSVTLRAQSWQEYVEYEGSNKLSSAESLIDFMTVIWLEWCTRSVMRKPCLIYKFGGTTGILVWTTIDGLSQIKEMWSKKEQTCRWWYHDIALIKPNYPCMFPVKTCSYYLQLFINIVMSH